MTGLFQYINFPDEPAEFQSKDDELAELRADLQAAQERIAALENDIICAFCGTHYHADDVPPQHYLTCESSPLVQRLAEQARQLEAARKAFRDYESPQDTIAFSMRELACIIPADEMLWHTWLLRQADVIDAWIAANPAPAQEPQS